MGIKVVINISEYVKVIESFYTRVVIWVDTILNHIDTRTLLSRYEGSCMVVRPKWYRQQNLSPNTHTLLVLKKCDFSL